MSQNAEFVVQGHADAGATRIERASATGPARLGNHGGAR
jgi:hypothetical protein